jgi:hypothetical protein
MQGFDGSHVRLYQPRGVVSNALRIGRGLDIYYRMLEIGSSIDDFLVQDESGNTLRAFDLTEMKDKYVQLHDRAYRLDHQ